MIEGLISILVLINGIHSQNANLVIASALFSLSSYCGYYFNYKMEVLNGRKI